MSEEKPQRDVWAHCCQETKLWGQTNLDFSSNFYDWWPGGNDKLPACISPPVIERRELCLRHKAVGRTKQAMYTRRLRWHLKRTYCSINGKILHGLLLSFGLAKASGILVPRPGIEPMSSALETLSLNHWTTKEVLLHWLLKKDWMFTAGSEKQVGWVDKGNVCGLERPRSLVP